MSEPTRAERDPDGALALGSPDAVAALRYLWARTMRNRLSAQFKRLRNPRYVLATILGIAYLWWALFRNSRLKSGGSPLGVLFGNEMAAPLAAALLVISSARWWLFGSDRSALAFTPAEVQFLFPAPISRRALVHARLVRGQIAILINTVIWTVLLRGGGTSLEAWRRGIAVWLLFSTLSLHRLGAAIVRANALEHERSGRRRSMLPALVFAAMLGVVLWGLLGNFAALREASAQGMNAALHAVVAAITRPIPSIALWPARALVEPAFATSTAVWITHVPAAFAVFVLHYVWVLRLDTSFEEAALEATQHRAERIQRVRTTQGLETRSKKGRIARVPRLALTGRPEVAIAWKNVAAAMRGGAWRSQVMIFVIALSGLAVATRVASRDLGELFIGLTFAWGGMLVFLGPLWMRFDLRLDLQRLATIKSYPLGGAQLVAAEIGGVTALHSITVWTLMVVPVTMFLIDPGLFPNPTVMPAAIVSVALGVPALNALMFTVQNATALLFPAWVRLGTEARGFETMGQSLLTTGATTLVAAVGLVFPVGLAILVTWLGYGFVGLWSLPIGTALAVVLIGVELWPVIVWLGRVFERTDVNDVPTAS